MARGERTSSSFLAKSTEIVSSEIRVDSFKSISIDFAQRERFENIFFEMIRGQSHWDCCDSCFQGNVWHKRKEKFNVKRLSWAQFVNCFDSLCVFVLRREKNLANLLNRRRELWLWFAWESRGVRKEREANLRSPLLKSSSNDFHQQSEFFLHENSIERNLKIIFFSWLLIIHKRQWIHISRNLLTTCSLYTNEISLLTFYAN